MTSTQQPKREIHECCWEFLQAEMITTLVQADNNNLAKEKLERIGFDVGQTLAERYTRERPRFADNLEIIKFICKEFWLEVFKKQVDNLRTNHKGVYVLHDAKFRWISKISSTTAATTKDLAVKYLAFPCGLIRGVLSGLGVSADVALDNQNQNLPACTFTIKVK